MIAQIIIPTVELVTDCTNHYFYCRTREELVIPAGIATDEANRETEVQPITVKTKITKSTT